MTLNQRKLEGFGCIFSIAKLPYVIYSGKLFIKKWNPGFNLQIRVLKEH